jgi:hypothetical protein
MFGLRRTLMAAWFTVYCSRSVHHVTAADLTAGLGAVDFDTVAEGFGIEDEAAVERAVANLRVQLAAGDLGEWFEVRSRPAESRPLVVYRWADSGRVQQELAEVREEHLDGRTGRGAAKVRAALPGVVEVVAVELGLGQLEDMGLVIAGQVAEYLAGVGKGLIRDTDDEWWAVWRGVPKLLLGRP